MLLLVTFVVRPDRPPLSAQLKYLWQKSTLAETHFPPGFVPPCDDIINMSWDSDDDADEVSEYLTFRKSNVRERENLYSSMFNAENQVRGHIHRPISICLVI